MAELQTDVSLRVDPIYQILGLYHTVANCIYQF